MFSSEKDKREKKLKNCSNVNTTTVKSRNFRSWDDFENLSTNINKVFDIIYQLDGHTSKPFMFFFENV